MQKIRKLRAGIKSLQIILHAILINKPFTSYLVINPSLPRVMLSKQLFLTNRTKVKFLTEFYD